jgi:hypothetical protein
VGDEIYGAPGASQPEDAAGNGANATCGVDPQAFIHDRLCSEVQLLLDNISANPEATIDELAARTPPAGLDENWIEQVCKIACSLKDGHHQPDTLARNSALLIKSRDYLNSLARPASGATIAFTLMVSQEDSPDSTRVAPADSRACLAIDAYPDLLDDARKFRKTIRRINWFALVALFVTLLASWYLAVGNAALAEFTAARTELVQADARVGAAQAQMIDATQAAEASAASDQAATPEAAAEPEQRPVAPVPAPANASTPAPPAQTTPTSRPKTFNLYPCYRAQGYSTSEMRDACLARKMVADRWAPVNRELSAWFFGSEPYAAAWYAALLGTGILPVLYGFLGAIAAVVRTLARKTKLSLLSPRDLQLAWQQLALGAVIGACVSLFIAAPGAGESETAMLGPVPLSASAISFVAGFGVESVFQALEALISRIFNIAPAGMGARSAPRPER